MTGRQTFGLGVLLAAAVLMLVVAGVVALGVVPNVRGSSVPDIDPRDAVPALQVSAGLHVLAAASFGFMGLRSRKRAHVPKAGTIVTAVAVLLLGFALSDAALAFGSAGPSLRVATILLGLVTAVDAVVGFSAIATAVWRKAPAQ